MTEADDENNVIEVSPNERWEKLSKRVATKDSLGIDQAHLAFDTENGIEVVWNEILLTNARMSNDSFEKLTKKFETMVGLRHKILVTFYDFWYDDKTNKFVLISELMTSGSLRAYLRKNIVSKTPEGMASLTQQTERRQKKVWLRWCRQIVSALSYLHNQKPPIVHGNLNIESVFVQHNGYVKVGAVCLDDINRYVRSVQDASRMVFLAPELYDGGNYTPKTDIYRLGLVTLEMVTLRKPYAEFDTLAEKQQAIRRGIMPECLNELSWNENLYDFVHLCLQTADKRPTADRLMFHPFLMSDVAPLKTLVAHAILKTHTNLQRSNNEKYDPKNENLLPSKIFDFLEEVTQGIWGYPKNMEHDIIEGNEAMREQEALYHAEVPPQELHTRGTEPVTPGSASVHLGTPSEGADSTGPGVESSKILNADGVSTEVLARTEAIDKGRRPHNLHVNIPNKRVVDNGKVEDSPAAAIANLRRGESNASQDSRRTATSPRMGSDAGTQGTLSKPDTPGTELDVSGPVGDGTCAVEQSLSHVPDSDKNQSVAAQNHPAQPHSGSTGPQVAYRLPLNGGVDSKGSGNDPDSDGQNVSGINSASSTERSHETNDNVDSRGSMTDLADDGPIEEEKRMSRFIRCRYKVMDELEAEMVVEVWFTDGMLRIVKFKYNRETDTPLAVAKDMVAQKLVTTEDAQKLTDSIYTTIMTAEATNTPDSPSSHIVSRHDSTADNLSGYAIMQLHGGGQQGQQAQAPSRFAAVGGQQTAAGGQQQTTSGGQAVGTGSNSTSAYSTPISATPTGMDMGPPSLHNTPPSSQGSLTTAQLQQATGLHSQQPQHPPLQQMTQQQQPSSTQASVSSIGSGGSGMLSGTAPQQPSPLSQGGTTAAALRHDLSVDSKT
eukprot:Clim_evm1s171 gene=Clim_evmTU1s171